MSIAKKVKCLVNYNQSSAHRNSKTNVLVDMHVLLSAAKNSTASNIRIFNQKLIPIIKIGSKRSLTKVKR